MRRDLPSVFIVSSQFPEIRSTRDFCKSALGKAEATVLGRSDFWSRKPAETIRGNCLAASRLQQYYPCLFSRLKSNLLVPTR